MIERLHGYPTVEESSAFIFYSNTEALQNFTVLSTVLHVASSDMGKIESRAMPGHETLKHSKLEDTLKRSVLRCYRRNLLVSLYLRL